ncbi:MAG: hypothetical protein QOJ16_3243 [Acidobacteriota bacterium]|jgi:hypothetical protein|nr:hypothetical protein [Acidobacteriota bacterium]
MKQLQIVLCGLVLALFAAGAWAVGPKARERGVESYSVADQDRGKLVSLKGNGGQEVGQLAVHQLKNSLVLELTEPGGAHLSIEWSFTVGRLSVKDLDSGESAQSFAAPGARAKKAHEDPLLLRYRGQIEMAFETLHDVGLDKIQLGASFHKRVRTGRQSEGLMRLFSKDEFADSGITCTGRRARGTNIAATRSGCCEGATDDANWQCWNAYCTGCCSLLSCDAVCALGDYACSCGVTGTSCEYTPPTQPPPPVGGGGGGGGFGGGGGSSCREGDLVTPDECVSSCHGFVSGDYCYVG